MGFGISFFKVPKNRRFDYKPRFYDPDKERIEEKKRKMGFADTEDEVESDGTPGSALRNGAMRKRHDMYTQKLSQQKKQTILLRILLIVMLTIAAVYILSDFKEELVEVLFNR